MVSQSDAKPSGNRVIARLLNDIEDAADELNAEVAATRATMKNYNPNQPRVPGGSPAGGEWAGAITPLGPQTHDGSIRLAAIIDYSQALTGFSDIDETTRRLSEILGTVMETVDFIPEWTPQVYGTMIHGVFAVQVRGAGIPGIGFFDVEQTFLGDGVMAPYGQIGSVRTDVIYRGSNGDVRVIYDVKTGNAEISPGRAQHLRAKLGVGVEVPVIQLQVNRGAAVKSDAGGVHYVGSVIATLLRDDPQVGIA